jgi:hypothetical protein
MAGYECELDVVAFHPQEQRLVHIEPSMDAHTWVRRESQFTKKFDAGRKYIPTLFGGIVLPSNIDQIALLGFASNANVKTPGRGRVMTTSELFKDIVEGLFGRRIAKAAVAEQYPLLRTVQFACEQRHAAGWNGPLTEGRSPVKIGPKKSGRSPPQEGPALRCR